jgi:four helix bundle protein
MSDIARYDEWERAVPEAMRQDSLWKIKAYRVALFIGDIGWHDVTRLMQDHRTLGVADQLYRALGSISANIAEGYSRSTGKDRARFYEYSLGSARESRDWYYKGRHILGDAVVEHRVQLLTEIIRLLTVMVPDQRQRERIRPLHDESTPYRVSAPDDDALDALLRNVPLSDL